MSRLVLVALKVAHNNGIFTYKLGEHLDPKKDYFGFRAKVNFRNRPTTGIIVGYDQNQTATNFKIKEIDEIIDEQAALTKEQWALMQFCSFYYLNDLGICAHLGIAKNEKKYRALASNKNAKPNPKNLSLEQKELCDQIGENLGKAFLLEGITGSGKTHIYIHIANLILQQKKSVLILVPEISLTPQLIQRVEEALGLKAVVMHSNISPAQKRDNLFHLLNHDAQILIGARSAIFAPIKKLGLIIVDEEHDSSLKQEESPRYHARDLALWRGKNENATVILGSATPSLESLYNVEKNKLIHLKLKNRFNPDSVLPLIEVIDLKARSEDVDFRTQDQSLSLGQKMCILSKPLVLAMKQTMAMNLQVLLFLNQRGYAKFGLCYQCGNFVQCPCCSVGLTYYQKRQSLMCHQCQHVEAAQNTCRHCAKDGIRYVGLGTERLEEEVRLLFPDAHIERIDRDIITSQARLEKALEAMHSGRAQILIGTQMIAKGHDFSKLGLVGVVFADVGLCAPDFRASEKCFQLLTQVSGRAGRAEHKGKAIIQSFNPAHPSIFYAQKYDAENFLASEMRLRKQFLLPPITKAALIRVEHKNNELCQKLIELAHNFLAKNPELKLLGPAPCSIEKINNRFRWQSLITCESSQKLISALWQLKKQPNLGALINKHKARLIIDVDPQTML